jgi:ATP-binding cassette subfamily B protein/ATP-binding cassette subfamily C protein
MHNLWVRQYWKLFATYLQFQRSRVFWLSVTLLGSIALQLINPQILRDFIDAAVAGASAQTLLQTAMLFLAIALLTQGTTLAATYLSERVAWTATNALRLDLTAHCLRLDLSFHKNSTSGELVERVDGDVNTLSRFFSEFILYVISNLILLLGILVVLWFTDWRAGLSLTAFTLLAIALLLRLQSIALTSWIEYRQINANFFGFLSEHLAATEDLRANGAIDYVMKRFYQLLQRWLPLFHRARWGGTLLWSSTAGLFAVGNAIALSIGAFLWSRQDISIGTVYLIFSYTKLLQNPIEQIRDQLEDFQQAEASIHRIQELFNVRSRLKTGGDRALPAGALSVTFDRVSFRYPEAIESDFYSLRDLSFHLPAGQVLGLLGRTGSGKTTIARLLLRLYDVESGSLRLGDVAIDQVAIAQLPERIGLVTQDVQLFQTTIRNNLTFFNPQICDAEVLRALAWLELLPWLESLPQGLDTPLGADNGGLSAGQAQLLAFVRVFLKNPGLVILDEASSRLDPLTERLVEGAIDRLLHNRTGIIIAHRLSTVQRADRILILEQGKLAEFGDRVSLAKNPQSRFAQLLKAGSIDPLT